MKKIKIHNNIRKDMLERKNILQMQNAGVVLTQLLDGRKKMTDLHKAIRNYSSLKLLVLDLEKMGLLKVEEKKEGKRILYVELTPKGRRVAKKFQEIRRICEEATA